MKPCPSNSQDWTERYKSINAFLNSRGGILVLGIKEIGQGPDRKYHFSGYNSDAEAKLTELKNIFSDIEGKPIDLTEYIPPAEIISFLGGRIAIQRIAELPAQRRFSFLKGKAYKRVLTGDHLIKQAELDRNSEFLEEISQARELIPLESTTISNIDLDRINEYIVQINRLQRIESIKPSLEDARPFLLRKRFLVDDKLTLLGGLVGGLHPGDLLGFRAHVHGYVLTPEKNSSITIQDKQDLIGNILPLLEESNAYILRNIQVGIAIKQGGTASTQYPEIVLRETINNALAHRDYSINKQIVISIKPGQYIEISNPGRFRDQLLINLPTTENQTLPLLRVVPETKPRNPRLADVLRVYRKWEGRGIGISTLVNLCLDNQLNLPYFRFKSDEVILTLQAGKLIDSRIEQLFTSRDAFISGKLGAFEDFSDEMRYVLAYIIKSEWANAENKYCVLLTPDNTHNTAIKKLEASGLIYRDQRSPSLYPIYRAHQTLMSNNFESDLKEIFGSALSELPTASKKVLAFIYCFINFSTKKSISAKQISFAMWAEEENMPDDILEFDKFYRGIRRIFNLLESSGFIIKNASDKTSGYLLARDLKNTQRSLF